MQVEQTTDVELIKSVLCRPEIYEAITDDNCPSADTFEPPLDGCEYFAGFVRCDIIGIMVFHWESDRFKCHIQVLPEFRERFALDFARMALDIGLAKNSPIYAEIPLIYGNVLKFAERLGFKGVETLKDSHLKDGKLSDVKVLRLDKWDLLKT